ncbi:MAG: hypothetical protein M1561_07400 [Gammaproteobacteria bacterium]|nr:hypothetical protein [Gammaproteobacteria bacterium]
MKTIKIIVLIACTCWILNCLAANTKCLETQNPVKVDLYLYFWPTGINGDVSAYKHSAHTNITFDDILSNLRMGATGAIKVTKNNWFIFNDAIYMDVAPDVKETLPHDIQVNAKLDNRVLADLLAIGYQWQTTVPWNLFAGVRYFYGRVKLDATAALGPFQEKASVVQSDNWLIPTIGGDVDLPICRQLSFDVIADVGAVSHNFNWELIPAFFWQFNNNFSVAAGYRLLDVYHHENDFKLATLIHGPIIGAKITF